MFIDFEFMPVETMAENENRAYISGNTENAILWARIAELTDIVETLESENFDFKNEVKDKQDYDDYKSFFENCFERLNGHYPCPSVTSDYDCSVIFEAIDNGEQNEN